MCCTDSRGSACGAGSSCSRVWLVAAIALVAVSHRLGENTNDNLSLPGTDSQRATDTLAQSFPDQANGTSPIVLHAHSGKLTEPKYATAVDEAAADVAKDPNVASVVNPLTPAGRLGAEQGPEHRLPVGHAGGPPGELSVEEVQTIIDARRPRQGGRAWRWRPAASSVRRSPNRRPSPAS